MSVIIPVGSEFFEEIRESGAYYVDKTELIYELVQNTGNKVTLFTRPRRFGKTLAMTMLQSFFDITRNSRDLFEGLIITKHKEFCAEWMNQYPVLFLTLKDVEGRDFGLAYEKLKAVIADISRKIDSDSLRQGIGKSESDAFDRLLLKNASEEEVHNSLRFLTHLLYETYQKQVIVLIDEYDVPLSKAKENGFYQEMLDVIRGMVGAAFKTNEYLKFAVITGCLMIAKESIFTGVNNFASYSVLDERFSSFFGFTQDEVDILLKTAGLSEKTDVFREWYDGYIFGSAPVYCPWDVVSYVSDLLYRRDMKPKNYWVNTSGNGVIRDFIENKSFNVNSKFETLMNGGTVSAEITDQLTYETLDKREDNFWSILLMTGYLTKSGPEDDGDQVLLKIPNKEISSIFRDAVVQFFTDTADSDRIRKLIASLWDGDTESASRLLSDLLWETISYNDYHEDYYHTFLTGIFVGRGYDAQSNKERGLGRPDIVLRDNANKRAMVIEAKRSGRREDMDSDCAEALNQITANEYTKGLDIYENVLCYGISFFKKSALVMKS